MLRVRVFNATVNNISVIHCIVKEDIDVSEYVNIFHELKIKSQGHYY
jgi:hypothetical protein